MALQHQCDQAVPIAKLEANQSQITQIVSQVSEQYRETMKKLDTVADLLRDSAVAKKEIEHLQLELQAQWRRLDEMAKKVELHITACRGPREALARANEAYAMAEKVANLPGKWAVAVIVAVGGIGSNILTAVIVKAMLNQ